MPNLATWKSRQGVVAVVKESLDAAPAAAEADGAALFLKKIGSVNLVLITILLFLTPSNHALVGAGA